MFLSKLAESKQSVVALKGIEVDMMSLLLDYAYSSTLVITRTNVQGLLSAANLLQVMPGKFSNIYGCLSHHLHTVGSIIFLHCQDLFLLVNMLQLGS